MCKYVIIDLEMCKVPKNFRTSEYHWAMETIQIGAVIVDENLEITDEFVTFVAPEFGYIDNYIKNLTGITRWDVKGAPSMEEAINALLEWAPQNSIFVSWSDSDKFQIKHEIDGKSIDIVGMDDILENWFDCQKLFADKIHESGKHYSLKDALIATGIIFDDKIHDGLVDARNTAKLFIKMKKENELQLSEYYRLAKSDDNSGDCCESKIGELFPWLVSIECTA